MQNLNKENFFDEMSGKYPNGMRLFLIWIDNYKKSVNWSRVVNPKFYSEHVSGHAETKLTKDSEPKFHDLPYEMQFGILIKYCSERAEEFTEGIERDIFTDALLEMCRGNGDFSEIKILLEGIFQETNDWDSEE